jgi:uncharacterized protein (UPF0335 family)
MSTDVGGIAADRLRSFVERIERMEAEIKGLNEDKSEIYKEAKSTGFDVKTIKAVGAKRRKDPSERQEQDALFDLYWEALEEAGTSVATRVHVREAAE